MFGVRRYAPASAPNVKPAFGLPLSGMAPAQPVLAFQHDPIRSPRVFVPLEINTDLHSGPDPLFFDFSAFFIDVLDRFTHGKTHRIRTTRFQRDRFGC